MWQDVDHAGFHAVNGMAGQYIWLDAIGIFCAQWLIWVMAAVGLAYFLVAWRTRMMEERAEDDAHAFLTVLLAYILVTVIGFLWYRPRPFLALSGVHLLIGTAHLGPSFPSGHTSLSFAIAFGIFMHDRRWGVPLIAMAFLVGFSRIYAGVHYPLDVAGGISVAFVAALLTAPIKKKLAPMLDWVPLFGKISSLK